MVDDSLHKIVRDGTQIFFHTVLYDRELKQEVLLGLLNGNHVRFPHQSWAYHMLNSDPRHKRFDRRRIEECTCDNTIHAAEFMKISHADRYGQTWDSWVPRVEGPKDYSWWSGERQPVLTRAQRGELQKGGST